jgi:hypothetical protein
MSRPLSRNASLKIFAGFNSGNYPFVEALDKPDFLGAVVFVLLTVGVSLAHRHDADATGRRDGQIERMIRHGDADAV